MSLESVIEESTVAMKALTAALLGNKAAPATTGSTKKNDPPAEPAHDLAAVTGMCVRVKNEVSEDKAKQLIKDVGKAKALKEVKKENWDALYDAAEAAITEAEAGDGL